MLVAVSFARLGKPNGSESVEEEPVLQPPRTLVARTALATRVHGHRASNLRWMMTSSSALYSTIKTCFSRSLSPQSHRASPRVPIPMTPLMVQLLLSR